MKNIVLIFALFVSGCSTQIVSLEEYMPEKYAGYKTVDAVKSSIFTVEAQSYTKDIPCLLKRGSGGYVIGANFWGTLLGVVSGYGWSEKCMLSASIMKHWGPESIVHEYIHHLDASGRSGGEVFIDLEEFRAAYIKMSKDPYYAGLVMFTESYANSFITDVFGIGEMAEHIAYVGARLAVGRQGPYYMKKVFRRMIK